MQRNKTKMSAEIVLNLRHYRCLNAGRKMRKKFNASGFNYNFGAWSVNCHPRVLSRPSIRRKFSALFLRLKLKEIYDFLENQRKSPFFTISIEQIKGSVTHFVLPICG